MCAPRRIAHATSLGCAALVVLVRCMIVDVLVILSLCMPNSSRVIRTSRKGHMESKKFRCNVGHYCQYHSVTLHALKHRSTPGAVTGITSHNCWLPQVPTIGFYPQLLTIGVLQFCCDVCFSTYGMFFRSHIIVDVCESPQPEYLVAIVCRLRNFRMYSMTVVIKECDSWFLYRLAYRGAEGLKLITVRLLLSANSLIPRIWHVLRFLFPFVSHYSATALQHLTLIRLYVALHFNTAFKLLWSACCTGIVLKCLAQLSLVLTVRGRRNDIQTLRNH